MTDKPTFDDPLDENTSGDDVQEADDVQELDATEEIAAEEVDAEEIDALPEKEPAAASQTPPAEPAPRRPAGPRKPWFDTYTAMLAISLLAIIAACLFLALELRRYDFDIEPQSRAGDSTSQMAVV